MPLGWVLGRFALLLCQTIFCLGRERDQVAGNRGCARNRALQKDYCFGGMMRGGAVLPVLLLPGAALPAGMVPLPWAAVWA